jgi:hypothetical protein
MKNRTLDFCFGELHLDSSLTGPRLLPLVL